MKQKFVMRHINVPEDVLAELKQKIRELEDKEGIKMNFSKLVRILIIKFNNEYDKHISYVKKRA